MAFVAFDIPPANAPRTRNSARAATMVLAAAPRRRTGASLRRFNLVAWIVIAIAAMLVLSGIAWNVTVETGSLLIGLGAADIVFLVALSFALSLRGASRSARRR